jgi:glycosyltransferase involved in cell wall biosynthesis
MGFSNRLDVKNTQTHLIFVHSFFCPDYSAGSQMLSDLSFYFAENGFRVSVITSRRLYDGSRVSLPPYEKIHKVNIYRTWSSNFGRKNIIGRTIDYLSLEFSLAVKLLCMIKKKDIVILMTDPPLLSVVMSPIVKIKGGIIVNWLQDLFPEVAVSAGLINSISIINKIITNIRNKCLDYAVRNVVIGYRMHDYLVGIGANPEKLIRIPNWSDGSAINPICSNNNTLRKEWGLKGKFVVGYSGNLGRAHDISTFLEAMEQLRHDSHIVFLFIGGGIGMRELEKKARETQLNNVIFKPYQPRNLLHLTLNVADVHWVTLEPKMEGFIVPSKIYGILAAGRPIIFLGDEDGEISREIRTIKCGVRVEIGDDKKLIEIIRRFSGDAESIHEMGRRGREVFQEKYDFPVSANKFLNLFAEITLGNHRAGD